MKSKVFYIYKITILRGKWKDHYYIGQHMTGNLDDNYKGSGKKICDWFKNKNRIEGVDYIKRIICYCDTPEEMNDCEWYYIYDKYKTDRFCLNEKEGGNHPIFGEEARKHMSDSRIGKEPWNKGLNKETNEIVAKIAEKTSLYQKGKIQTKERIDKRVEKLNDPTRKSKMIEKDRNTQLEIWNTKTENERKEHGKKTSNAMYGQRLMSDGKDKHWVMKDDIQYRLLIDKWFFCDKKGNRKVA